MDDSRQAADDALMDRQSFRLDAAQFAAFVAALDAPPASNDRLRRLIATQGQDSILFHNRNMTIAARATAERNTLGHLS